jgi:hypothetical protein
MASDIVCLIIMERDINQESDGDAHHCPPAKGRKDSFGLQDCGWSEVRALLQEHDLSSPEFAGVGLRLMLA